MHIAAQRGAVECLKILLDAGAAIDTESVRKHQ